MSPYCVSFIGLDSHDYFVRIRLLKNTFVKTASKIPNFKAWKTMLSCDSEIQDIRNILVALAFFSFG